MKAKQKNTPTDSRKPRVPRWKSLKPVQFLIDPGYPSEFVSTDLDIYVNLAGVPEMPFEDLVFHVNRAILTETLCYYITASGYPRECAGNCVPNVLAKIFLKWLGFKVTFDCYKDYKSYLKGGVTQQ